MLPTSPGIFMPLQAANYRFGSEDGETKTESSNGYVPLHTVLARLLRA